MNTTAEKRGPGRPRKEEDREESRRRRRVNGPTFEGKLGVPESLLDRQKYEYHFLNDEQNGRIYTKTNEDDWDLVPNVGESEDSTDLGAMYSRVVGSHKDGSPKRAYLARKLKTYFDEDKAREQVALDQQLEQLKRGRDAQGASQSDYVPHSGISM